MQNRELNHDAAKQIQGDQQGRPSQSGKVNAQPTADRPWEPLEPWEPEGISSTGAPRGTMRSSQALALVAFRGCFAFLLALLIVACSLLVGCPRPPFPLPALPSGSGVILISDDLRFRAGTK